MHANRLSRRWVWLMAVLVALATMSALAPTSTASTPTSDVAVGSPGGEPQIAVNPRDPRNIVVGENVTGVAYSRDGGRTWKSVSIPNLGDNVLTAQPDGTFLFSSFDGKVYASRDGGATWAKVGNWVGAVADTLYSAFPDLGYPGGAAYGQVMRNVACNAPAVAGAGPLGTGPDDPGLQLLGCDRPWLATDPQNGRTYLSFSVHSDASGGVDSMDPAERLRAVGCRANNGTSPFQCGRQYVSASGDAGRTWTTFKPMDSRDYPAAVTEGWSGGPVASFGTLATAYVANGPHCPNACIVFETSKDDGGSWRRRVVAPVHFPGASNGLSTSYNFEPYIAADPSRAGRYAVLALDPTQKRLLVYVTEDAGDTWTRTELAEPGPGVSRWTPWIAYGPSGALGVTWRTAYADGTFDAWAAVSVDGAGLFRPAVRLSSARSPGPVATGGDDASDVVLTRDTLYAAWGDQRGAPPPAGWFGSAWNHVGSYRFS